MTNLSIWFEDSTNPMSIEIKIRANNISSIKSISFQMSTTKFAPGYELKITLSELDYSQCRVFKSLVDGRDGRYNQVRNEHEFIFSRINDAIRFLQNLKKGIPELTQEDNELLFFYFCRIIPKHEFDRLLKSRIDTSNIDEAIKMISSREQVEKDSLFYEHGTAYMEKGLQDIAIKFYRNILPPSRYCATVQSIFTKMMFENVPEYNIQWFLNVLKRGESAIPLINRDIINKVLLNNDHAQLTALIEPFDHTLLIHIAKLIAECNQQDMACEWFNLIYKNSISPNIIDECLRQLLLISNSPNDRLSYYKLCMRTTEYMVDHKYKVDHMKQLMEVELRSERVSVLLEHILKVSLKYPDIFYFAGCVMAANGYPLLAFCFFERINESSNHFKTAQLEIAKLIPNIHPFFAHADLIKQILEYCLNSGEEHIIDSVEANKNLLLINSVSSSTKELQDENRALKAEISRLKGLLDRQSITSLVRSGSSISSLRDGRDQLATSNNNGASCSTDHELTPHSRFSLE